MPRKLLNLASSPNAVIIHGPKATLRSSPVEDRAWPAAAAPDGIRAEIAGELFARPPCEAAVGIEPRHLVFVLVGHQLEQRARNRFGSRSSARRLVAFGLAHRSPPSRGSARHRRRSGRRSGKAPGARSSRRGSARPGALSRPAPGDSARRLPGHGRRAGPSGRPAGSCSTATPLISIASFDALRRSDGMRPFCQA